MEQTIKLLEVFLIGGLWVPASVPLRVKIEGSNQVQDLERYKGKMNSQMHTFLPQFLYSSSVVLLLFCEVSSLYMHTKQRQFSKLGCPFSLTVPHVIYMKDSFPDCMFWPIEHSCREVTSNVSQVTERRCGCGTKVYDFITKFSHWRSHGVGKAIQ